MSNRIHAVSMCVIVAFIINKLFNNYEAKFSLIYDATIDFGQVIRFRIRLKVSGTTPKYEAINFKGI